MMCLREGQGLVLPVPRLRISGLDTLDSGSLLKITQSREDHQLNYLAHDTTEPLAISHPGHSPATWAVVTPVTCRYINTSSSMGTLNTETLSETLIKNVGQWSAE